MKMNFIYLQAIYIYICTTRFYHVKSNVTFIIGNINIKFVRVLKQLIPMMIISYRKKFSLH